MFTGNSVTEIAFFKGYSLSKILLDLVIRLQKLYIYNLVQLFVFIFQEIILNLRELVVCHKYLFLMDL